MSKETKRGYVIYSEDDLGNGSMYYVKVNSIRELIDKNFPKFDMPDIPDGDDESDIISEFEMWCGENNYNVKVFDIKRKKTVIE